MADEDQWVPYQAPAQAQAPADEWIPYQAPAQAQAPTQDEWVPYRAPPPPQQEPLPEAEGKLATAGRELAHGVVPGAAGAYTGMLAGAALGSAVPVLGTLGGGIIGGLAGGLLGGYAASTVQESALNALGFDDSLQRAVNAKENPWSSAGGAALSAVAGGGPGALTRAAAPGVAAITGRQALGIRAASGAIGGGFEAGSQLAQGEELDPTRIAATAAGGAIFAKPYSWGNRAGEIGENLGARWRDRPRAQPHGAAGPDTNSSTAAEPVTTSKDPNVGFEHPISEGSETKYMPDRDSATGDNAGVTVKAPGDIEPTLKVALDAEAAKTPPEAPTPPPEAAPPPQTTEPQSWPPSMVPTPEEVAAAKAHGQMLADEQPTQAGQQLEREFPRIPQEGERPVPFTERQLGRTPDDLVEPQQGRQPVEQPTLKAVKDPETGKWLIEDSPGRPGPWGSFPNKGAALKEINRLNKQPQETGATGRPDATSFEGQAAFRDMIKGLNDVERVQDEANAKQRAKDQVFAPGELLRDENGRPIRPEFAEDKTREPLQPREPHPKLKEAVDRLNANRERLAAENKRAAAGEKDIAPEVREGEIIPPLRVIKDPETGQMRMAKPAADDLEIPSFLDRRTPKPATVAEEPVQAGGREIAPASEPPAEMKIRRKAGADITALEIQQPDGTWRLAHPPGETVSPALKNARRLNAEGGPTYPHASVPRPKLEALIKAADEESSRINQAMIDAGRGHERPTDIRDMTDQLSMDKKAISEWQRGLNEEMRRRLKGHGKRTPLPKEYRDTFYAGESLRQDVLERGPRSGRPMRTERLPIGNEQQILEAGMAKATGPKGEPREPEMLAARRKGSKPIDWDNLGLTKDADGNWQGTVRLYRGEKPDGTAAIPGSDMGGGWYTTNLAKAQKFGEVKVLDVDANDLKKFMQGHGGKDEFLAGQDIEKFRARSKPLDETPDAAIDAAAAKATGPTGVGRPKKVGEQVMLGMVQPDGSTAKDRFPMEVIKFSKDGKKAIVKDVNGDSYSVGLPNLTRAMYPHEYTPPSAARGQPSVMSPTGGGVPPGGTVQAAAGGAGTPPPGAPPNVGAAAAPPGGGGGPGTPNMGHTPPQQQSWLKGLWRDVQRKTAAHLLGPEGMEARYLIRSSYGPTQRVAEQTASMLKDHTEMVRGMSDRDRMAMINTMQGDDRIPFNPTPEQKTFMGKFERMMQEWEAQLHQLDATEQMKFRKDFMAHMYENATTRPDMFTGMGKRGSAGSTKERKHDTYLDAEQAGLIMKTTDPIEIGTRYANSIKDFVASRNLIQRGEATDRIGYFGHEKVVGASGTPEPLVTGGPPPGWKKLNGVSKGGKDGYAPADFADVYNNFMDKGFKGGESGGNVYDAVRNSTNAWTQLELGINAYHLFTMANEAIISDVGGALNKAFKGDFAGAGKALKDAPMAWRTRAIEGAKFQKEYLDPNSTNPIAAIIAEANGRPVGRGHAADYSFTERGSFINKWDRSAIQSELKQAGKEISADFAKWKAGGAGDKFMIPLQQGARALQTVAAPIFDKYIPALKAGAVQAQMKDWHAAMMEKNPAFDMIGNAADRRTAVNAAMKIVDSVDNRFGEMIHDNMFMNATLKQSAQVGMRSFSWAIGAIKEIGGGTAATGKALYQLGKTRGAENRFDMTHPEWDPRMAYAIAFPFVVSAISTMYQMLLGSHDLPENWRDLYAPRTGGTVPGVGGKGQVREHVLMPGYQKDVLGWIHHPVQEAYNKMGGLPTTAVEQLTGKDWRGDPIVKAGASFPEAAAQRMAHVFGKLSPISVKNMTKGVEPTSNISVPERLLGFRAPGAHIQDPAGLKRAMDFKDRRIQKAIDKRERKIQLRQNPQQVSP